MFVFAKFRKSCNITSPLIKYASQFMKYEARIRSLHLDVFFTSLIFEFYVLRMLCPHWMGFHMSLYLFWYVLCVCRKVV